MDDLPRLTGYKLVGREPMKPGCRTWEGIDNRRNRVVAIKFILLPPGQDTSRIDEEFANYGKLKKHPNIIRLREVQLSRRYLVLVMDYANSGTFADFLKKQFKNSLFETTAILFFKQLIQAVSFLHANNICHRDIKLTNLFLHEVGLEALLKLGGFGFSKPASEAVSIVGTPAYMAPEILRRWARVEEAGNGQGFGINDDSYDGKAVDVWCCGVVLYYMVFGKFPFISTSGSALTPFESILAGNLSFPSDTMVSEECMHLISLMLNTNPSSRITVPKILLHPWLAAS